MQTCQDEAWGNPSSKHRVGDAARQRMNSARAEVAALLVASAAELVFTSGATEGIHTAVLSALAHLRARREAGERLLPEQPAQRHCRARYTPRRRTR